MCPLPNLKIGEIVIRESNGIKEKENSLLTNRTILF